MSRDISRSMWGVAGVVTRLGWGVDRYSVILNGTQWSEESGWGRPDHPVTPREGLPDRGSLAVESAVAEQEFADPKGDSHVVRSALLRMTGWVCRPRTYSPTGFFAAAQNDGIVEIVSKAPQPHFSSKCRRCDSPTERDDWLYSAYCPLSSDEERKQVRYFHGKFFVKSGIIQRKRRSAG